MIAGGALIGMQRSEVLKTPIVEFLAIAEAWREAHAPADQAKPPKIDAEEAARLAVLAARLEAKDAA